MNELEFRRRLLTDPQDQSPDFLTAEQEYPGHASELVRVKERDRQLRAAMTIPTPEGLEARILLKRSFGQQPSSRPQPRQWRLAWAASLLLGAGVAGWFGFHWQTLHTTPLSVAVFEHIAEEHEFLFSQQTVPLPQVKSLLGELGVQMNGELLPIRYAGLCRIRGQASAHLVLSGEHGPVTMLIMPGQPTDQARTLQSGYLGGRLLPLTGGSIAIVGVEDEPLDSIVEKIEQEVIAL